MLGLSYQNAFLTIGTTELTKLVDFYCQLFNQQPQTYLPQVYAEFQLQGLRLGIFQPKEDHRQEFIHGHGSTMSLCLEVDNLEEAVALLTTLGYAPPGTILDTSHGREIYAYDPMGNRLILHQCNI